VNYGWDSEEGQAWPARFNTGLAEVDTQHREMAAMLDTLSCQAAEDADNLALLSSVQALYDYTQMHFAAEERLMADYALDPAFAEAHHKAHVSLAEQVRIVASMLENALAPSAPALCKLLPFLQKWMIFHVIGTDMRMARMIQTLQRGGSHDDALREGMSQQVESLAMLLDSLNELYDDLSRRTAELQEAHHKLSVSEARYALAQRAAHIGSWEYELASTSLRWSQEVDVLLGYAPGALTGGMPAYLACVHPDDRTRVAQALNAAIHGRAPYDIEYRIVHPDGACRWLASAGDFLCAPDGAALRLVGVVHDISEQKAAQSHLQDTNQQLTLALSALERHASDLTRLNDLNEGLQSSLTVHDAYEVLEHTLSRLQLGSGGSLAVVADEGSSLRSVVSWGEGAGLQASFAPHDCWAMRRGQRHALQTHDAGPLCKHFDKPPEGAILCQPLQVLGETLGLLSVKAPRGVADAEWARINHLASMISESLKLALSNIRLREALHEQAIRDPLTRLLNRRYLAETLPRELHRSGREHRRLSLVMLDLDHFKRVNDTWGHEAGDAVLAHVASIVRAHLRASDLACRFGGEEFVVVLLGADGEEALERIRFIAAKVRESRPHVGEVELPAITFSAGVAEAFVHGDSAEQLLRAADHALYDAKEAGRDRIVMATIPAA
jgi:diguanylate cyclase (GGDEF)-like protein/hemerythrin-like metal-binding protein/PAS domain S-box-containing protein